MGNYAVSITWPDGFSQVLWHITVDSLYLNTSDISSTTKLRDSSRWHLHFSEKNGSHPRSKMHMHLLLCR
jgi:23S rRNA-/tRNA-specific pseudouridylate synthase